MLRLRVMGQSTMDIDGVPVSPAAAVLFATALVLAVERGRRVQRDWLAGLLWPESELLDGRHSLRQMLYKLRRLGVPAALDGDAVMLDAAAVFLDHEDTDSAADTAHTRDFASPNGVAILPGYTPTFSAPFTEWLDTFRERIEGSLRRRVVTAMVAARQAGRWDEVEQLARNCLEIDPLNEEATLALAESLALAGSKAKAVGVLDEYLEEVGGEEGQLAIPATLLRRRISKLPEISGSPPLAHGSLVGRSDEMRIIAKALADAKMHRGAAVLFHGPSGSGKTRLLEEASRFAAIEAVGVVWLKPSLDDRLAPGSMFTRLLAILLDRKGALGTNPDALELLRTAVQATQIHTTGSPGVNISQEALLGAAVDLVRAIAWESPLCVLVDDSEQADTTSSDLLQRLFGSISTDRVAAFLTSSEPPQHRRNSPIHYQALRRLNSEESAALITSLLTPVADYQWSSVAQAIADICGGLPLALVTACSTAFTTAVPDMPGSLSDFLRRRVASLPQDSKSLLLSLILLGNDCTLAQLTELLSLDLSIEPALLTLNREGFVGVREDGQVHVSESCRVALRVIFSEAEVSIRRHFLSLSLKRYLTSLKTPSPTLLLKTGRMLHDCGHMEEAANLLAQAGRTLGGRGLPWSATNSLTDAAAIMGEKSGSSKLAFQALCSARDAANPIAARAILGEHHERLHESLDLTPFEKMEVSIIELEASLPALSESEVMLQKCIPLLTNELLDSSQRLKVAVIGARTADHLNAPDAVRRLAALAQVLPVYSPDDRANHQHILTVASIAHRNLPAAIRAAEQTIAEQSLERRPLFRALQLLNARIPYWYDCQFGRVYELIMEAHQISTEYPASYVALRVADVLATHHIEMLELDAAWKQLLIAIDLAEKYSYGDALVTLRETHLRLDVARRLPGSMIPIKTPVPQSQTFDRSRMFTCCNELIFAARARDQSAAKELLAEMEIHWSRISGGCPIDYAAVSLAIGLHATGRRGDARTHLRTYFDSQRPARYAPAPLIQSLVSEFKLA